MDERLLNGTPLMENMWTVRDDAVYLLGSICENCGEVYFPQKEINVCSNCQHESIKTVELSREGEIHSFTQVFQPPAGGFYKGSVPFIYGLVKLPDGVIIPGHILADAKTLKIGDKVEVVLDVLYEDDSGPLVTYKFKKIRS